MTGKIRTNGRGAPLWVPAWHFWGMCRRCGNAWRDVDMEIRATTRVAPTRGFGSNFEMNGLGSKRIAVAGAKTGTGTRFVALVRVPVPVFSGA